MILKVDFHSVPWVACNGSSCLLNIYPRTMKLSEYKLPDPKTTVWRLDCASDGMI